MMMDGDETNPEEMPVGDERDLAPILDSWRLEPAAVTARYITGVDGARQIQLRIPMGVLQLDPDGRPDGQRYQGFDTTLDAMRDLVEGQHQELSAEQWYEIDREIMQYYHRRVALLALAEAERREQAMDQAAQDYTRAVRDADHNLRIMDFIRRHHPEPEFVDGHEQYRAFVMGHRILAATQYWICRDQPEEALSAIQAGLDRLKQVYDDHGDSDAMRRDPTAGRLVRLAEQIRKEFSIAKTLGEQLSEAIEAEQFEKAAELRDRIQSRMKDLQAPFES